MALLNNTTVDGMPYYFVLPCLDTDSFSLGFWSLNFLLLDVEDISQHWLYSTGFRLFSLPTRILWYYFFGLGCSIDTQINQLEVIFEYSCLAYGLCTLIKLIILWRVLTEYIWVQPSVSIKFIQLMCIILPNVHEIIESSSLCSSGVLVIKQRWIFLVWA
jgi:hypothetical protein